jgi:hypothetical protein
MTEQEKGGWTEFRQLFLKTMTDFDKLREEVIQLKIEQAVIKFKLFMWGAVGASVATGLFNLALWLLRDKFGH